ncbi:helix-turn-helix domain-containing protein [Firmicutes bacterium AM41-5BH]|nr:helix-turn-helix domain-containing protein [Firmicutes bacterium AM41-5BH]
MKKEYDYPTLKVICQASAGNENAIREILKFYDAYICKLCLRPLYHSESGKADVSTIDKLKNGGYTVLCYLPFQSYRNTFSKVVKSL